MTRGALVKSLALWRRRHAYRQRKLDVAHQANDAKAIQKWQGKLADAGAMIRHREQQLAASEPLRLRAYKVAETLIGVMEQGGNNMGPYVSRIIHANGGVGPEAWCGDFQAYCYRLAGSKAVMRAWASVSMLGSVAGVRRTITPLRGNMVRFTFDHVGMFSRWLKLAGGKYVECPQNEATHLETIEGNTGASGAVSDSSTGGDGVYRKVRARSLVRDFLDVTR